MRMASCYAVLASSIITLWCAGTVYSFGSIHSLVRDTLKNKGDCSSSGCESDTSLIGISGNVGMWTNVLGSLFVKRFGTSCTLVVAGITAGSGYLLFSLAIEATVPATAFAVAWFCVGIGSGWMYIGCLVENVGNFPEAKAYIIGVLATTLGSSSAVFVSLLSGCVGGTADADGDCGGGGWMGGDLVAYTRFAAVALPATSLVTAALSATKRVETPAHDARLMFVAVPVLLMVLLLAVPQVLEKIDPMHFGAMQRWVPLLLALPVGLVLCIPAGRLTFSAFRGSHPSQTGETTVSLLDDNTVELAEEEDRIPCDSRRNAPFLRNFAAENGGEAPSTVRDATLREACCSLPFFLLCLAHAGTVACDLATLNLVSGIAEDRGGENAAEIGQACVVFAMALDAVVRFTVGFGLHHKVLPPACFLVLAALASIAAQGCFLLEPFGAIYAGSALLGISDGIIWSTTPWFCFHLFGAETAPVIFGICVMVGAVFITAVGFGVEPAVYRAHQRTGESNCTEGMACYQWFHLTCIGISLFALGAAFRVHFSLDRDERPRDETAETPAV